MPLREHLEELRRRLFQSLIIFSVLFFVGIYFKDPLIRFVLIPWETAGAAIVEAGGQDPGLLTNIGATEPFIFSLKLAAAFALLGGAPFFLFQFWAFVGVGLVERERKAIHRAFPLATILLVMGMAFGYRVLLPLGLQFLVSFVSPDLVKPEVTLFLSGFVLTKVVHGASVFGWFDIYLPYLVVPLEGLYCLTYIGNPRRSGHRRWWNGRGTWVYNELSA